MALWLERYYSEVKDTVREDRVLRGITAYVEVWSGNEKRNECVKEQLKSMGAIVADRFTSKVNIVVFNDGTLSTYKKAKEKKIPLVSTLWVEESKRLLKRACVKTYRALRLERYEEPDIFSNPADFKRPRHVRSVSSLSTGRKRKKRDSEEINKENDDPYETYFNPHIFDENAAMLKNGVIGILEHVTGKTRSEIDDESSIPCSQFSADINEPLSKKLYNRFLEETKEEEEINEEDELKTSESSPQSNASEMEIELEADSTSSPVQEDFNSSLNISMCQISGAKLNGIRKENSKISQVPITFFFQASVIPNKGKAIVFTGFEFDESEMLSNIVFGLGGYKVDRSVSGRCTHVVTNIPPKRTLNMLRGIARGCWIVSKEWVLRSLDTNSWLAEDEFEIGYFLPAIKKARVSQQNGPPFPHRCVFSSCGPIYVGNDCSPPSSELKELISLCGGQLATCSRSAKVIVVGQGKIPASLSHRLSNPQYVTEKWVLDSISEESLCAFNHSYVVHVPNKKLLTEVSNS